MTTPLNPEYEDDCVETATRFGIESAQWSEATSDPAQRDSLIDYKGSKVGKSRWECEPTCRHQCPSCRMGLVTHLTCDPHCIDHKEK